MACILYLMLAGAYLLPSRQVRLLRTYPRELRTIIIALIYLVIALRAF